ncbi:DNA cytosine methyltransferase [Akkermansiaceae bacterium]|nr:DNA cytosine methyltransferase [Akkermansiaceae bacterium]
MSLAPIPIIDLFAGPGGLGEGFSRNPLGSRQKDFKIALSIEKDPYAHKTLTTRAFYRQFPEGEVPDDYYSYLQGEIDREELFKRYPEEGLVAKEEAQQRTLGEDPEISKLIGQKIKGHDKWVLIGGPPCQAYSLAGRSRMLGLVRGEEESERSFQDRKKAVQKKFESDHRHTLYREYLKIIADHSPPVFVMENVKGILSAKLNGKLIFPQIIDDLSNPCKLIKRGSRGPRYRILSLVKKSEDLFGRDLQPRDYLIKSEEYSVPQARHRVILLGVREDLSSSELDLLSPQVGPSVSSVIQNLPKLTPGVSKGSGEGAYKALSAILEEPWWPDFKENPLFANVAAKMEKVLQNAENREDRGGEFYKYTQKNSNHWYADSKLVGVPNHQTRSHIRADLWRYFFCASFAEKYHRSPSLKDFPRGLLPKHRNVEAAIKGQKFGDRFRVQCGDRAATTITSHISKDGHYFIHPDPRQSRSLTVREAARLQTFPDNYRFEGPRTQQYHQVGNAVPPLLAYQIAEIVSKVFS